MSALIFYLFIRLQIALHLLILTVVYPSESSDIKLFELNTYDAKFPKSGKPLCGYSPKFFPTKDDPYRSDEIGIDSGDPMISKGWFVYEGQFPFLVKLKFLLKTGEHDICSGAIISPMHIISAADCVKKDSQVLKVDYSTYYYSGEELGRWYPIQHTCKHFVEVDNRKIPDFAIFTTFEPIEMSKIVQPICLQSRYTIKTDIEEEECWAIGYHPGIYEALKARHLRVNRIHCPEEKAGPGRVCWQFAEWRRNGRPCKEDLGGPIVCRMHGGTPLEHWKKWFELHAVMAEPHDHRCSDTSISSISSVIVSYDIMHVKDEILRMTLGRCFTGYG